MTNTGDNTERGEEDLLKDEFATLSEIEDRLSRQYQLLKHAREYEKNKSLKSEEYQRLFNVYYREGHSYKLFTRPSTWTFITLFIISLISAIAIDISFGKLGRFHYLYFIAAGISISFIISLLSKADWSGFSSQTTWNWLDLLFVPILLAIAAFYFDLQLTRRQTETTQIRNDQQTMIEYIDKMKDFLKDNIENETSKTVKRKNRIMESLTFSVLYGLNDPDRKAQIIQFLYKVNLINLDVEEQKKCSQPNNTFSKTRISLAGTNIEAVNLEGFDLRCANLRGANLRRANFKNADLREADLRKAITDGADFTGANITGTKINVNQFSQNHPTIYKLWQIINLTTIPRDSLKGAKLSNANLNGVNLSNFDLTGADLTNANLRGANLTGAILKNAKLSGVVLDQAKLNNVSIDEETLEQLPQKIKTTLAILSEKNSNSILKIKDSILESKDIQLQGLNLQNANLSKLNLVSINLSSTNLEKANLAQADLSNSNLNNANLYKSNLSNSKLINATLISANLALANLKKAILTNANLEDANLNNTDLSTADLSNSKFFAADLSSANLSNSILTNTSMQSALLEEANLEEAKLSKAKLQGAVLEKANLKGADLSQANLQAAKLKEADLSQANLQDALYDEYTIFPESFNPESHGLKKATQTHL